MTIRRAACAALLAVLAAAANAQTDEQSEESIAYLTQRVCASWDGAAWALPPGSPQECCANVDCDPPAYCRHGSDLVPKAQLYPKLEFPEPSVLSGSGEGFLRYVPLCEDGSGDHEYSLSGGRVGEKPTCSPQHYIRCADGARPYYRADAGTGNNWLIYAGGGGHASAPGGGTAIWTLFHTQGKSAYSLDTSPKVRGDLKGIFDEGPLNPFADYNRVWLEKCTPDRWLGNRAHHDLQDFVEPLTLTEDVDECESRTIDPPKSPNAEYSVYYHGKRIVRAVLGEILSGLVTYDPPMVEDTFLVPDASSTILFTCHSNGCNGLQGGHIDDLHAFIDATVGEEVDVRALFSSRFGPAVASEVTVSDYDCVDVTAPFGVPDNPGDIDDSLSLFDQTINTRSITLQPMSMQTLAPQGRERHRLVAWWDPSAPGYSETVDASCLDHHCPTRPSGWANEPDCAPCNESEHVLMNHLTTPFFYNQAQKDKKNGTVLDHCQTGGDPDAFAFCDVEGQFSTGINVKDTHWRKLVRKQLADSFRLAELDRCEGGPGKEWPYNHMMLLAPNWDLHEGLSEAQVLAKMLKLPNAASPKPIGELARNWVDMTTPAKAICLTEEFAGENDLDFDDATKGPIEVCEEAP